MTPNQIAADIRRDSLSGALAMILYQEQHDTTVQKLNKLMKPIQQQEAA